MFAIDKFRLRQSVGVVHNERVVEFFCANTRNVVKIRTDFPNFIDLLRMFDGVRSVDDVLALRKDIDRGQLIKLIEFLNTNYILIKQDVPYPEEVFRRCYRLINLLEDYFLSTREVLLALKRLRESTVMIIGLGAVGSMIAVYLARSGVRKFVFVDADDVDSSNLHRQYFFEDQIGERKSEALRDELRSVVPEIDVLVVDKNLTEDFFVKSHFPQLSLIVNCADEPSVDATSRIISAHAMKNKIPHIVGGGYNLHLTLVGQTIIPFETACFECFNIALSDLNDIELRGVKKLHREGRKLGAYPPLSGIASTLASLDAFKILIGRRDLLQQSNKRIEFDIREGFKIINIPRSKNCKWCGVSD